MQLYTYFTLSKNLCRPPLPSGMTEVEILKWRTLKSLIATGDSLMELSQRLTSRDISIETVVKDGDPGKVIIHEAREWHADLIVLGWHGHRKLRRLVTGESYST